MRSLLHRLRARHVISLLGAVGLASGCVVGNGLDSGPSARTADAGPGGTNVVIFDSGIRDAQVLGDGGIDRHCGSADYCSPRGGNPDDALACAEEDASSAGLEAPDGGLSSGDAASREAGSPRDAGAEAGDSSTDASLAHNADPKDASEPSPRKASLPVPAPLPPLPDAGPRFACQVARDASGGPVRQCVPSGLGAAGSPCKSVSDCRAGLACVGQGDTGQCFPYCCAGAGACARRTGTYCADRPLLDGSQGKKPLLVPVCAPGEDCDLLQPFPCMGSGCSCDDPLNTACTVVRPDGTRGCVAPGNGKVNEPCPCSAGYYCSLATSSCVKICKTDGLDERCAPGKCQAAASFPPGFGLCVGYAPSVQ